MNEIITRLRQCAEELSSIADAMSALQSVEMAPNTDVTDRYEFDDEFEEAAHATIDELVEKAKALIRETGKASTSHFQRRLGWGYNRASEVMDELERLGFVGPFKGAGTRDVFMS